MATSRKNTNNNTLKKVSPPRLKAAKRPVGKPKSRTGRSTIAPAASKLFGGRRAFVVAGLLAIAGLIAVAFSFAASTPAYQYSIASAKSSSKDVAYYAKSAEGFTYLAYKGLLGRAPEQSAMNTWVQKLAGDRTPPTNVLASIIASSGVNSRYPDNKAFVVYIYKNFLGRAPDKKGQDYWLKQLKNGRSRQDVVRGFIAAKEVTTYNQSALLDLAPASFVESARNEQKKRGEEAKTYANQSTRFKDIAQNNAKFAKARRDEIAALRNKPKAATTQSDLASAKAKLKALTSFVDGARRNYTLAVDASNKTKSLKSAALRLQKRAPDLSAATVVKYSDASQSAARAAQQAYNSTTSYAANAQQYIKDIQKDLAPVATTNAQGWIMGSKACGGSLPPCYVMNRESGGGYINIWNGRCTAPYGYTGRISPCGTSSASGKWQFIRKTWGRYGGYLNAADAPESVQDAKAREIWNGGRGCSHWQACGRKK